MTKNEEKKERIRKSLEGSGQYVFKNITKGDLILPKYSIDKKKMVGPQEEFKGDSFFFTLVKSNMLLLVREDKIMQEKLITEVPPIVTSEGTVEIIKDNDRFLIEKENQEPEDKKVIVEKTMDGVKLLLG